MSAPFVDDPNYEFNRRLLDRLSDLERRLQLQERIEHGKVITTLSNATLYAPNITNLSSPSYALTWDNATGRIHSTALVSVPTVRVKRNSTSTIPTAAWTAISFAAEVFDTDNMWVSGSSTRITFNTAGKYIVGAFYSLLNNTSGGPTRAWSLRTNGANYYARKDYAASTFEIRDGTTDLISVAAADYMELVVYQDSGANMTAGYLTDSAPIMYAVKVSD